MKKANVTIFFLVIFYFNSGAQQIQKWDDPAGSNWPAGVEEIIIISSADSTRQRALAYRSKTNVPSPLIISLHTWSGDYKQKDTIGWMSAAKDFNYIHPDFRGPNNTPEAAGSDLVISDIDDAIDYGLSNFNVDKNNIHIIGASGGGHAALIAYMKSKHNLKSVTSFVAVTNLVNKYYESLGRGDKYWKQIAKVTSGSSDSLNIAEAKKRSPFYMDTPIETRKNCTLSISTGIHDGYIGSVPITHSLYFYNKVVKDIAPLDYESLIPRETIETLLRQRNYGPQKDDGKSFLGRNIIYSKEYKNRIRLVVFEGGHEMPSGDVIGLLGID